MRYLPILIFTTGAVTLGMELSASRLLEPVFGNSQLVWAALIGLILLYLSTGAWLGGRLADRLPERRWLDLTLTLAAVGIALAPAFARPVLTMAAIGIEGFAFGLLAGSLVAILVLFSIPGILLGTAVPWAVRLSLHDMDQTGRTAGRFSAIATAGSLTGTFIPVLWLIPSFGTRWTFFILSLTLLLVIAIGTLRSAHRWAPWLGIVVVLGLAVVTNSQRGPVASWRTDAGPVLYEDESLYNYIAVHQWGSERHLRLNEGVGLHSVYHPQMLLSQGIWDYFLLAPLVNQPPADGSPAYPTADYRVLLIGLAAGTVSNLYTDIYGPVNIVGVELDPEIIEVGRRYFDMNQPNLNTVAADGRRFLLRQPPTAQWDLVAVDAYRPPYIPFHLTTVEFFQLVHRYLADDGVLAVNVGRTATNFALVDAISATLKTVFPSVYIIDEPGPPDTLANSLVIATKQPTQSSNLGLNIAALPPSLPAEFRTFAADAHQYIRPAAPPPTSPIFTDDKAPIEQLVHGIILDFLALY